MGGNHVYRNKPDINTKNTLITVVYLGEDSILRRGGIQNVYSGKPSVYTVK
jgi:hypothetical protein